MMQLQSVVSFTGILVLFHRITAHLAPQQYHLINGSLSWSEARSFCRVKYSDLATVTSMDDENRLVHMLGHRAAGAWIGLHRGRTVRWMWSDGSGRAHFTRWRETEPNNVAGNEWCGGMSDGGGWNDMSCEDKKSFVCYERQGDGKERYVYYSEGKSWEDSQEQCRSTHSDLAKVRSEAENSEIAGSFKTWISSLLIKKEVWIGLFKDAWTWSDGRESSFRYWLKGSHSWGDCASVAVSQQGHWVRARCDHRTTFVCQGGLKVKKMVIRMKVLSGVDLTDSTLSDALLRKMETGLRLQSVADFSLRWRSDKAALVFQLHKSR